MAYPNREGFLYTDPSDYNTLVSNSTWVWEPIPWLRKMKHVRTNVLIVFGLKYFSLGVFSQVTWLCACPQQIHDILMVSQVSHHLEFRHESFFFRTVCFFCKWKSTQKIQNYKIGILGHLINEIFPQFRAGLHKHFKNTSTNTCILNNNILSFKTEFQRL